MELVEFNNLKKYFNGVKAVDDVTFTVRTGEIFGLLGPNGAGKSTAISVLSTLLRPTAGDVVVKGKSILSEAAAVKRIIGLVPQDIALYPTLSARENLAFFGRMYGLGGRELAERIDEVLEIAGLADRAGDRVETFSGGMKRRINIGVGLMNRPELLILDEPTVGIDPQSRNHILESLQRLNREGMTILYTSHYMEEVEFLCHRVGIMDRGRLIALGNKEELRKLAGESETIEIEAPGISMEALHSIQEIPTVSHVVYEEEKITLLAGNAAGVLNEIIARLSRHNCRVRSLHVREPNLEAVFLQLTGKALRD